MVVIAIDAWTKRVVYRIINPLDSRETSRFLHEDIIWHYGVPEVIQCDQGKEFEGDFAAMCQHYGISQHRISLLHPRANGLIERYNHEVKSVLQQVMDLAGAKWYECLPDVMQALQLLPTSTTGRNAFELIFKQQASLPIPLSVRVHAMEEAPLDWATVDPEMLEKQEAKL